MDNNYYCLPCYYSVDFLTILYIQRQQDTQYFDFPYILHSTLYFLDAVFR